MIDIPINNLSVNNRVYNCSIVSHKGILKLLYRYEFSKKNVSGHYNTRIGMVELDNNFKPVKSTDFKIPLTKTSDKASTFDDPRAFIFNDDIWFVYATGCLKLKDRKLSWCSGVGLCKMENGFSKFNQYIPEFGKNINTATCDTSKNVKTEKNWSPFVHNGKIHLVYTINPLVVLQFDPTQNKTELIYESNFDQSFWEHGSFLGGGTPLLKYGNGYSGFFHSYIDDHSNSATCRVYNMGYYSIEEVEGKWKVTSMSRVPLMTAERDWSHDLRNVHGNWMPNCIYPCGWMQKDNDFYVSIGWQDCRCKIVRFTVSDILQNIITI